MDVVHEAATCQGLTATPVNNREFLRNNSAEVTKLLQRKLHLSFVHIAKGI